MPTKSLNVSLIKIPYIHRVFPLILIFLINMDYIFRDFQKIMTLAVFYKLFGISGRIVIKKN